MIFDFLKKQKKDDSKRKLTKVMILNLNIPEEQKSLYLQAIDILNEEEISELYEKWSNYVKHLEIKEIEEIRNQSFSTID
jgi:hypothetical protein